MILRPKLIGLPLLSVDPFLIIRVFQGYRLFEDEKSSCGPDEIRTHVSHIISIKFLQV